MKRTLAFRLALHTSGALPRNTVAVVNALRALDDACARWMRLLDATARRRLAYVDGDHLDGEADARNAADWVDYVRTLPGEPSPVHAAVVDALWTTYNAARAAFAASGPNAEADAVVALCHAINRVEAVTRKSLRDELAANRAKLPGATAEEAYAQLDRSLRGETRAPKSERERGAA